MLRLLDGVLRLVLLIADRLLHPTAAPKRTAKQVLAEGLRERDAIKVATAYQMRHDEAAELLRKWQIAKAKRGIK